MAYKKFDRPADKVSQAVQNIKGAFPIESIRRALQGISNRVLQGTAGTGAFVTAGLTDGSTGGVQIANAIDVLINGRKVAVPAANNIELPDYTQEANTVCKYLVSVGTAGTAVVTGPGNVVSKADYDTAALAAAAAFLPELPTMHCAIGYVQIHAPAAVDVVNNAGGLGGTQGTSSYVDLICMPYQEPVA